jgi:DNA-binding IclR family transcriptional regulator
MTASETGDGLRTTEISLQVIECLVELDGARTEEVAAQLGIAQSTAHRHLSSLREFGYVVKDGEVHRVGLKFLTVGGYARSRIPSFDLARDAVDKLAEQTGERAQFVVHEQGQRIFLYTRTGENAVRAEARIGRRGPLHPSAAGKAMLAQFPEEKVRAIVDRHGLEPVTENTITDIDELLAELEEIAERGVAYNREESTPELHAVGTPVLTSDGNVYGALSVSGPAYRLTDDALESDLSDVIRGLAHELELNIKYDN